MKKELRKKYLDIRASIPADVHALKSKAIFDNLKTTEAYKDSETYMIFLDFRGEVATRPIINELLNLGKTVALPVVDFNTMELVLVRIDSLDNLVKSKYGIYEPIVTDDVIMNPNDFDLMLAPGAVFDEKGYRIGYGGGFYDKLLVQLTGDTEVIGLAFSEQMIDNVPHESFDQPLDGIVTDEEIIICK
jgi:5-formyltetrahydrofolate cyclo-ligase